MRFIFLTAAVLSLPVSVPAALFFTAGYLFTGLIELRMKI